MCIQTLTSNAHPLPSLVIPGQSTPLSIYLLSTLVLTASCKGHMLLQQSSDCSNLGYGYQNLSFPCKYTLASLSEHLESPVQIVFKGQETSVALVRV